MEFAKKYIIQCIGHSASNIRLRGEALECLSALKNFIHKCEDPEYLFLEMKKITSLAKLGIKLNEIYHFADSDRLDFSTLSKQFNQHSASLSTPLMFLLNDITVENLLYLFDSIKKDSGEPAAEIIESIAEPDIETQNNDRDLIARRDEFNTLFLGLIKELNIVLDKIKQNKIEEAEIKRYISLLEDKVTIAEDAGIEIVAKVLSISITALNFIIEFPEENKPYFVERIRSSFIVTVAILRGKDIDIGYYLRDVDELAHIIRTK